MTTLKQCIIFSVISIGAVLASSANAKGCLTGAAIGGVAGHVAGKNTMLGAAAGCLVGRHRAKQRDKELAAAAVSTQNNRQASSTVLASAPSK